jgi:formate hydrogenlyase subunit 3/multisubunit Na+/H+ antiporter MnhD subunit
MVASVVAVPLAAITGLANQDPALLPFAWIITALLTAAVLRGSGSQSGEELLPMLLVATLGGLLALTAALLFRALPATFSAPESLVAWTLLSLLAVGAPPFGGALVAAARAPAALAAVIVPFGMALLGGGTILRFAALQNDVASDRWRVALIILGLLTMVVSAAGASRAERARPLIGHLFTAQLAAVLIACGLGGVAVTVAAPALLVSAVLSTHALLLALAALERRAGSDELEAIGAHGPLALPAVGWLIAAASAVGVPGTLGFWGRLWLLEDVQRAAPWALAPLLAASTLLALALVAPLAALLRRAVPENASRPASLTAVVPALAALPLLLAGAAPDALGWSWLRLAQVALAPDAPAAAPPLPGAIGQVAAAASTAALLMVVPLALRGRARRAAPAADPPAEGVLTPAALGESLSGLSWLATPDNLLSGIWAALVGSGRGLARLLGLLEHRYYLAGLVIAMIVVLLVFF